jgi:hypothetical protein
MAMAIPAEVVKRFNRLISAVRGSEPAQLLQMMDNKDGNPAYLIVVQEQSDGGRQRRAIFALRGFAGVPVWFTGRRQAQPSGTLRSKPSIGASLTLKVGL